MEVSNQESGVIARVRGLGVRASSPIDLIAIGYSRRLEDVEQGEDSSRRLLQRFQSLQGLGEASPSDLSAATGLESYEVLRLQALQELGRRIALGGKGVKETVDGASDVAILLDYLRFEKKEHFVAILLDAKSQVIRIAQVHVGTLTMSVVGLREVFREAIREGAASIIVAHNHPSGDPTPSPEDIDSTRRLIEAGALLDIPLLDHVIIGDRRHVSLREERYVNGFQS